MFGVKYIEGLFDAEIPTLQKTGPLRVSSQFDTIVGILAFVGVIAFGSFCVTKFSNLNLQFFYDFNACINNRIPGIPCCNEFYNLVCVLALIKGRERGTAFCTYESKSRPFCSPHYWCCAPALLFFKNSRPCPIFPSTKGGVFHFELLARCAINSYSIHFFPNKYHSLKLLHRFSFFLLRQFRTMFT